MKFELASDQNKTIAWSMAVEDELLVVRANGFTVFKINPQKPHMERLALPRDIGLLLNSQGFLRTGSES